MSAVAEVIKNSLSMTVWGYVRALPTGDARCASVDEYRWMIAECTWTVITWNEVIAYFLQQTDAEYLLYIFCWNLS